jgi:hypothetical protein
LIRDQETTGCSAGPVIDASGVAEWPLRIDLRCPSMVEERGATTFRR